MNRLLLSFFASLLTVTLNAQIYVGGTLGMSFSRDVATATTYIQSRNRVSVAPEIGYSFNKLFSLGASVGYNWAERAGSHHITIAPYARITFVQWAHFGLFVDALYEYSFNLQTSDVGLNTWKAGLSPGIKIPVTDKCGFTTRIAFIGWERYLKEIVFLPSLNIINSASVGFYWTL